MRNHVRRLRSFRNLFLALGIACMALSFAFAFWPQTKEYALYSIAPSVLFFGISSHFNERYERKRYPGE